MTRLIRCDICGNEVFELEAPRVLFSKIQQLGKRDCYDLCFNHGEMIREYIEVLRAEHSRYNKP